MKRLIFWASVSAIITLMIFIVVFTLFEGWTKRNQEKYGIADLSIMFSLLPSITMVAVSSMASAFGKTVYPVVHVFTVALMAALIALNVVNAQIGTPIILTAFVVSATVVIVINQSKDLADILKIPKRWVATSLVAELSLIFGTIIGISFYS